MFKCKYCGKKFGPYNKRTFNEYGEEELWGHIQTCHEKAFEKIQNLETPDMLHTCYRELNPCLECGCWDGDMGCTMPSIHRSYACPLEDESEVLKMDNTQFQKELEEMYGKYSIIAKRKQKTLNELVYVLRMSGVNYQLTITRDDVPNGCVCIPGVIDTFIPVRDLAMKVVSVEFDEETYEDCGVELLLVKVEE